MKLDSEMFSRIKSGSKKIEIRLFDEKRQQISVGDTIIFTNTNNSAEQITVKVIDLTKFHLYPACLHRGKLC